MTAAKAGDTVELNDKETGFSDPETGFDISRDARVKLTDPIGTRTNQAVVSGCLLVVAGTKKAKAAATGDDAASGDEA